MDDEAFEAAGRTEYRYLVQEDEEQAEVRYARPRSYVGPVLVLSRRCLVLVGGVVLALLLLASYLGYLAQTPPPSIAVVTTACGDLRGRHMNGAYFFKGVPYASPPLGELRWAPPTSPPCDGVPREAGHFGSVCAQVRPLRPWGKLIGREDCLYLNVWTPSLGAARLPVVVWIHGGHLHMLSGDEPGYAPSETLAAATNTVYVSFNYRLNAFGFLALEALRGGAKNTSGNYGFLDQVLALRWVQENIGLFGGDPGRVTIMGQSSGGTSVWTLMASPLAVGLFQAAVDMSGSSVFNVSLEEAESANLPFLQRTGCRDAACLRNLSVLQVLQAVPWEEFPSWAADDLLDLPTRGRFVGPVAVVDGYVLEAPPLQVWEGTGGYSDVPFVIGTTEQEVDFSPPAENISTWTWSDYHWFVTEKLQTFSPSLPLEALSLYPSSAPCPTPDRCPERSYSTMVSDIRVTCPNNQLAERAAAALSSPVYRYVVTLTPSVALNSSSDLLSFPSRFSFHCLDAVSFFGSLGFFLNQEPSPQDRRFQEILTRNLLSFFRTGRMEADWPEFPAATALLSDQLKLASSYPAERCELWKRSGLLSYAWIN